MNAGLSDLQVVDLILAWLVVEDQGAHQKIESVLKTDGQDLTALKSSLVEQMEALDLEDEEGREEGDRR